MSTSRHGYWLRFFDTLKAGDHLHVFLSLILICLLWAALHFYVVSRLLSIPFIAHHVPARLLIPQ